MKTIVIAGGIGFAGGLLTRYFENRGDRVRVLTRRTPRHAREVQWDGRSGGDWEAALSGADALFNFCGASVNCRYTRRNRRNLIESRLVPTRLLGEVLGRMAHPPPVWLNASTATLYRHNFGEPWDESGEIGAHPEAKDAFSIDLAQAWEDAFFAAVPSGVRPVALRMAMVLGRGNDPNNVLTVLRRLCRCGLGGRMGHGGQFISWTHEADFVEAADWILRHPALSGPVNVCAPCPERNHVFMRRLRAILGVPAGLPAPKPLLELGAFFLRTETELVIKSRRVYPGKLLGSGYCFRFPDPEAALTDLLRS